MIDVPALLQELIRFDTTNPPGNETGCVLHLKQVLEAAGLETWTHGAQPERLNLVARKKGRGEAPPLLLQGHVDVVTTANQSWAVPPFEGRLQDGEVWGRGAIDMKGGVAMMVGALLEGDLPGDVVLAVLADEEAGGVEGAGWLVANHPEHFAGIRHALGEGGGFASRLAGRRIYPIMVAEKRGAPIRATFRGPGGHGSRPLRGGAMAKLGRGLATLDSCRLPARVIPPTRLMLESLAAELPEPEAGLVRRLLDPATTDAALDELGADFRVFDFLLHNTVSPNQVQGGYKINVVPSEVTLDLDCRMLPGVSTDELLNELRNLLRPDAELAVIRENPFMPEPQLGPYFETLRAILREADPGGTPIPFLSTGGTDARHFAKLGIQTYGFLPHNWSEDADYESRMHDSDERVPVSALQFGTKAIREALLRYRG